MGQVYDVASHIRGDRNFIFDIQKEYFILLDKPKDYNFFLLKTLCRDREEYITFGQALWHKFIFIPVAENKVDGKFIEHSTKWGFYTHQWRLLSKILTRFNYSWQNIIIDENDDKGRPHIESNENDTTSFDHKVKSYFIVNATHITPTDLEFVEINEIG